nr:MAG: replication polyprotein [Owegonang virus 22]
MSNNEIYYHAFTLNCTDNQDEQHFATLHTDLQNDLRTICEHFMFQLERGNETNRLHYQGYIHLKKKQRSNALRSQLQNADRSGLYITPASDTGKDELKTYCMKSDTKVAGPWSDKSCLKTQNYIPKHLRHLTNPDSWYPFQKDIVKSIDIEDDRIINCIYNPSGCKGKSTIASLCELLYDGIDMPPLNDFKEMIALLCNICMDREIRSPKIVFIDMPRAIRKDQLYGMYSAIEQIKKGKLYDTRYHYKSWWIDSPQVWVFTNTLPDMSLLSADRWRIWEINDHNELIRWLPSETLNGASL